MIINTGSRTDIPAYYSEWFYRRIKEGYVYTRNPYRREQVIKYILNPSVVDCINFCTKNPEPMLERIDELNRFRQLWFVTITPYGKEIEPGVPEKRAVIESFRKLAEALNITGENTGGKAERKPLIWRYDPILITERYSVEFHLESFEKMAAAISGYTDWCVISFVDLYEKTKRNFPGLCETGRADQERIGREFVRIGRKYGIGIKSCCEGTFLEKYGVDISGCMSQRTMEQAIGCNLLVPHRKPVREGCTCLLGSDIGMYNTCGHGCLYCYANYDRETVERNRKLHDPLSPFLLGELHDGDSIRQAEQESWLDGQLRLF